MFRRSAVTASALVIAFVLGMVLMNQPPTVVAQAPAGRGKCIGFSVTRQAIYRAFEDGTVELSDTTDGVPGKPWVKLSP